MKLSYNKPIFYFFYVYYKLLIFKDVKRGKKSLYLIELIWVLSKFINLKPLLKFNIFLSYCETKFGKYYVNPDLITNVTVSPSFERLDINHLLSLIREDVKGKKSILFIDVGAFFGLYTIAVANEFKKYKKINILSFEPGTDYLSLPTYSLLKKNVKINNIKNVKLYHFGLGDKNTSKNKWGIKTVKLDTLLSKNKIEKYDSVFMKIDVDGAEKEVIHGAENFIKYSKELTILIEDFVDNRIVNILNKKLIFQKKISPYNSFWYK